MHARLVCLALFCSLSFVANAQQPIGFGVFDDILGYFDRQYKGKPFAGSGTVEKIAKTGRLFQDYWYLQIESGGRKVYCTIASNEADLRLADHRKRFPIGSKANISGSMIEWVRSDDSLRLDDFCRISN